jgi:nucleoid-associated protein EbfC
MSDSNPFGGLDLNALMEQAQAMQQQVVAAQLELAERTVDGTVGDGLVSVTVNGNGELVGVKIRANSFDPADTEDLEDLLVAAYRDARARADAMAAQALDPLAAALDESTGFVEVGGATDEREDSPGQGKPTLGF